MRRVQHPHAPAARHRGSSRARSPRRRHRGRARRARRGCAREARSGHGEHTCIRLLVAQQPLGDETPREGAGAHHAFGERRCAALARWESLPHASRCSARIAAQREDPRAAPDRACSPSRARANSCARGGSRPPGARNGAARREDSVHADLACVQHGAEILAHHQRPATRSCRGSRAARGRAGARRRPPKPVGRAGPPIEPEYAEHVVDAQRTPRGRRPRSSCRKKSEALLPQPQRIERRNRPVLALRAEAWIQAGAPRLAASAKSPG